MKFLGLSSNRSTQCLLLCLATFTMLGEGIVSAPSSHAVTAATRFFCGKFEGKPATLVKTKKGDVAIVIWSSDEFNGAGYKPQVRCQQVSARFQSLYSSNKLKYITAGKLNNLPVICSTLERNGACSSQNVLYTLKPSADPQQTIARLQQVRNRATNRGIEESAGSNEVAAKSIEMDWLQEDN